MIDLIKLIDNETDKKRVRYYTSIYDFETIIKLIEKSQYKLYLEEIKSFQELLTLVKAYRDLMLFDNESIGINIIKTYDSNNEKCFLSQAYLKK